MKIFRKLISVVICLVAILSTFTTVNAEEEIRVLVNGKPVVFSDVKPLVIDGRTFVPLRSVGEALGASVAWRQSDLSVHVFKDGTSIVLTLGSPLLKIQRFSTESEFIYTSNPIPDVYIDPNNRDIVAQTINGRTMVPLRAIAEALGGKVGWYEELNSVTVDIPINTDTTNNGDKYAVYFIEQMNYYPETKIEGGDVLVKINPTFEGAPSDFGTKVRITIDGQTVQGNYNSECFFSGVSEGIHDIEFEIPDAYRVSGKLPIKVNVKKGVVSNVQINIAKR